MPGTEMYCYLFGPVPSRRLGLSLGVDILPLKKCTLDCVYCQLGGGRRRTAVRREYAPTEAVLAELEKFTAGGVPFDCVTFSGSGEPTLHLGIGRLVREAKRLTGRTVAVITNGTLLDQPAVRADLAAADIVLPSLDAARGSVFRAVNRPHRALAPARLVRGVVLFRREFRGQLWLEVMLVRGMNDSPAELDRLKAALARIRPDRIQLNTVVRPPAEKGARPLTREEMAAAARRLGGPCEIIADFPAAERARAPVRETRRAVLAALARRPMTAGDVAVSFGLSEARSADLLERLAGAGLVRVEKSGDRTYYLAAVVSGKNFSTQDEVG